MMDLEIPVRNEMPLTELHSPVGNETPLMILEIPIGITTAYGLTTFVFSVGTTVPASTHEGLFTLQDSNSRDYHLQLVQGFNSQSIFNTYLGTLAIHIPEAMPRFSEIHLIFELEASGLTVYAESDSTRLLHFDGDVIFPPIEVVNSQYKLYSMRLDWDKDFFRLTYKKYELAEYLKWVTGNLDIVTHQVQRQVLLDWIEVSNGWLELDGTEEEYQEVLDKVMRGCNDVLYPLLCPNLVQDSGSEFSEDSPDSDLEDEVEDEDEDIEEDSDSELVEVFLASLLWLYWDSHD